MFYYILHIYVCMYICDILHHMYLLYIIFFILYMFYIYTRKTKVKYSSSNVLLDCASKKAKLQISPIKKKNKN